MFDPTSPQTYVVTDASGSGTLTIQFADIPTFRWNIPIKDAHLVLNGDGSGMLGAVTPTAGMINAFVDAVGGIDCGQHEGQPQSILVQFEQASDILSDGSNSAGQQCNAISIGMQFWDATPFDGVLPHRTPARRTDGHDPPDCRLRHLHFARDARFHSRMLRGPLLLSALCLTLTACSTKAAVDADAGQPDGASGHDASNDAGTSGDANQAADSNGADGGAGDATLQEGGNGFTFAGCPLFAPGYAYNVDVSSLTPDPTSASTISNLTSLAPDIAAEFPGGEYYNVVPASQADVAVGTASYYGFDPDGGFFYEGADASAMAPIPPNVVYENAGDTERRSPHDGPRARSVSSLRALLAEPLELDHRLEQPGPLESERQPRDPRVVRHREHHAGRHAALAGHHLALRDRDRRDPPRHRHRDGRQRHHAVRLRSPCVHRPVQRGARGAGDPVRRALPAEVDLRHVELHRDAGARRGARAAALRDDPTDASGESRSVFRLGQDTDGGTLDQTDMNQLDVLTWADFDVMPLGTVMHPGGCQ